MPSSALTAKPIKLTKLGALSLRIQKNKKLFVTYVVFLVIYTGFTLIPQPPQQALLQYHLNATQLRLLSLTIVILIAAIWGTAFYGFARLHDYAKLVRKQKDGANVAIISRGIFLLAMWLPISETVSAILGYVGRQHLDWLPTITIINNYLNLALPLAAFIFIGIGAGALSGLVKRAYTFSVFNILTLVVIYSGVIYTRLVATTPNRTAVYHMSIWLIFLTIVAPYIYMWLTGVTAAYEIYNYQHKVGGLLYRRSWRLLAFGLGWLIATSIAFQFLTSLGARWFSHLSIYGILAVIYMLLGILSVGFILIAIGAARLQRIEEV